jgi:hypothetical protein
MAQYIRIFTIALALIGFVGGSAPRRLPTSRHSSAASYIVQAPTVEAAIAAVEQVGGAVQQPLAIINAVQATLDPSAHQYLATMPQIRLHVDSMVQSTGIAVQRHDQVNSVIAFMGDDDDATTPQDDDERHESDEETDTAGYYLYPAAATGVHPLHRQTVLTPRTECKDQKLTRYDQQEQRSLQGWGVTVAVIDSGLLPMESAGDWKYHDNVTGALFAENSGRCIIYRDFLPRSADNNNNGTAALNSADQHGHGTHIISTIADNRTAVLKPDTEASPVGVAPKVNLMVARALDTNGAGAYSDVITAIEWIINNRETYNVRVLNLSLYAPVAGPYWADPLNQAVMRAWQAGIVVVVAAGNSGPAAGTITVPGNVPYVITVGALTSGRYTKSRSDELARYSSRGPTESAFVKPDVLVPATRTIAPMPNTSTLAHIVEAGRIKEEATVDYGIGTPSSHKYYQLSGTSMAAAQVSGIVALMLQANPDLPNDQIKYRLLATARPAIDPTTSQPIYSIWEQGAGLVHAQAAVSSTSPEKANINMNITQDLQTFTDGRDELHYWGNTTWSDSTGEFRLINPQTGEVTHMWDGKATSWAGGLSAWAGGLSAWAGGLSAWAGGLSAWAGGLSAWAGGLSAWAGGLSAWAGTTGAPSAAAATAADLLLDHKDGALKTYHVMVPMVAR